MKKFKANHLFSFYETIFTEEKPLDWLLHKDYKWWYEGYILKLEVGESRDLDFQKITRIE